ncbi:DUF2391 family protein [Pseudomonadota bacterium]
MDTKKEVIRVNGKLKEVITVFDKTGKILHKTITPLMVEFYPRDIMQVIIGATILAIPVAFTEETWNLGSSLPLLNILGVLLMALFFISIFVYYNFYRGHFKGQIDEFFKRVLSTYFFSFLVVAVLLTLIQRAPWATDWLLAVKRTVLVSFPASMSAAVSDMIK